MSNVPDGHPRDESSQGQQAVTWEDILLRKNMLTPLETTISGQFDVPSPSLTFSLKHCPICGHMCTGLTPEEISQEIRPLIGGFLDE